MSFLWPLGMRLLIWQVVLCAFGLVRPPEGAIDLAGNLVILFPVSQRSVEG